MPARIPIPKEQIADFCRRWKIVEFSFFGSVLRDDFSPTSDVDVLVSFASDAEWTLLDRVAMIDELKTVFGRNVDLAVEKNLRNPFRRKNILRAKEVFYAV